jgi:hypothetical protein
MSTGLAARPGGGSPISAARLPPRTPTQGKSRRPRTPGSRRRKIALDAHWAPPPNGAPVRASPWSQFWSHSPPFTTVHGRPQALRPRWSGRWRTPVNGGAQYSKACEGATPPWVQIPPPPPPPLTCDDASPPCLLGGGGHRGGLSFGPQMVSVDRAEIPAAGWIGPELRPRTAVDMI